MSTPLTDEQIAEIRKRKISRGPGGNWAIVNDKEALVGEIARLKAARPDWADLHTLLAEGRDTLTDNELTDAVWALFGGDTT